MPHLLYFSYGSNMSLRRLRARVPVAQRFGVALLRSHRLRFHKRGRDGSAKCDAQHSGNPADRVLGVLFRLPVAGKALLDSYEGLGNGYRQKQVPVHLENGLVVHVMTYCATHIDPLLKPFSWYKTHVLTGAAENRLPPAYIGSIERVAAIDDPDPVRHAQELSIYP